MDYSICRTPLDRIETADHTFKITTNTDVNDLALSIRAIGLLHPPILIERKRRIIVVSGFRRISACRSLGLDPLSVHLLAPSSTDRHCAQIAVADNALQRPLNIVETSRAYRMLQRLAGSDHPLEPLSESTGLAIHRNAIDKLAPLADMPEAIQQGVLEGSIALPIALKISQMDHVDSAALSRFFRQITTGLNLQREFLTLISEIALREDTTIAGLLEQPEITSVLGTADLPTPQKVKRLRSLLKSRRYPELTNVEVGFNEKVKSLGLNPRMQLQPPPFFEGKIYRLTLTFDSRHQLSTHQGDILKLVQHPDLIPE